MSTREEALKWWRGLDRDRQIELSNKVFPGKAFVLITTSSSKVEWIFRVVEKGESLP